MPKGEFRESPAIDALEDCGEDLLSQTVETEEEDTLLEDAQETIVLEKAQEMVRKEVLQRILKQIDDEKWYLNEMLNAAPYVVSFASGTHEKRKIVEDAERHAMIIRLSEISLNLVDEVLDHQSYERVDQRTSPTNWELNNYKVIKTQRYRMNAENRLEEDAGLFVYWREKVKHILKPLDMHEEAMKKSGIKEYMPKSEQMPAWRDQFERKL